MNTHSKENYDDPSKGPQHQGLLVTQNEHGQTNVCRVALLGKEGEVPPQTLVFLHQTHGKRGLPIAVITRNSPESTATVFFAQRQGATENSLPREVKKMVKHCLRRGCTKVSIKNF
jgi:hypothetical protein